MKLADISIIIPNYNHSIFIENCFKMLSDQTMMPREIIIIDDGSVDDSVAVIEKEIKKFKIKFSSINFNFFKNNVNKGVIYTENLGAKKASSKYIYFLSVDDEISEKFIEVNLKAFLINPEAGLSSSIVKSKKENGIFIYTPLFKPSKEITFLTPNKCQKLFRINDYWTGGNSCVYNKSIFLEMGGLNEKFKGCCDIYLAVLIVCKFGAIFIPENLTTFNLNENSYSGKFFSINGIKSLKLIYKNMFYDFINDQNSTLSKSLAKDWYLKQEARLNLIEFNIILKYQINLVFPEKNKNKNYNILFWLLIINNKILLLFTILYLFFMHGVQTRKMISDSLKIKFLQFCCFLKIKLRIDNL